MKVKKTFNYKGSCDKIFLHAGAYYVELWGAQGKSCISNGENYSFGGYSKGLLFLNKGTAVSICVGGKGEQVKGGWNGGGDSVAISSNCAPGGGGMTDLSIGDEKILIAGGGGGSSIWSTLNLIGGNGGGISGTENDGIKNGKAGTSTSGGKGGYYSGGKNGNIIYEPCNASSGTKYQGGNGCSTATASPGGGGGGYFGGGAGADMGSGGGGSGFVNNDYILKGVTNTSKHTGNGLAKITYYDTIGCLTRRPNRNLNILLYVLIVSLAK